MIKNLLLSIIVSIFAAASIAQAATTPKNSDAFLVKDSQPQAVIVVGNKCGPFYHWVAEELQRYIKKLSGAELSIVTDDKAPTDKSLIVVGDAKNNAMIGGLQQKKLIDLSNLKADGYVLKNIDLDHRPVVVVAGSDEPGTMYAAYDLLQRLGMVFQLVGDVIPQHKPNLLVPAVDMRSEPAVKYRGLMAEHAFGSWYMGIQDYREMIDQMAKLKLNMLQFTFGMGSPFLKFSYNGKVGELVTTPESHYTAWGTSSRSWGRSPHTTTGTSKDIRVGKEAFPEEYVGSQDFANVKSPDEAFSTAEHFLHELIRYAHERHVKVCLLPQELSFVPPNMAERRKEAEIKYQRYCGVALSPSDPATLNIWEAAMQALIKTYPEADAYGFWTTEHSPDLSDPATKEILQKNASFRAKFPSVEEIKRRGNAMVSNAEQLDCDFLQVYLAAELIKRVKSHNPDTQLAVMSLFRGYKLPLMDSMMPKDVWLGNMEECATTGPTMSFYGEITGRELFVIPRISDDGDELHMQLNATEYNEDEIITGAVKYHLAGIIGQLIHPHNSIYSEAYLAEGSWNPKIQPQTFYREYLSRLYGPEALDLLVKAFLLLEENEKSMVYWGRSEIFMAFMDFMPLALGQFPDNINYRTTPLTVKPREWERINEAADQAEGGSTRKVKRDELVAAINAKWGQGNFWKWRNAIAPKHADDVAGTEAQFYEKRANQCRKALMLLREARAKVLPGSRSELEYVIYKTENLANYYDVRIACCEACVALNRAWLALFDGNWIEFGSHLQECQSDLEQANRFARATAGQMISYTDDSEEKYLLLRFNRNVIVPIEAWQKYVAETTQFYREHVKDEGLAKDARTAETQTSPKPN